MKWYFTGVLSLGLVMNSASAESWTDRIKVGGDLRYRHEVKAKEVPDTDNDARNRQRIRARVGIDGKVNDQVKVGLRIATGKGENVSTNQSLGDNASNKSFNLDLAYFQWQWDSFRVTGGKMKHLFYRPGKSELIFDSDLTPEGLSVNYDSCPNGECPRNIFANGHAHWLKERFASETNKDDPDTIMYGGQIGIQCKVRATYILGMGFYTFTSVKGKKPLTRFAGNSFTDNVYDNEFNILQVFFETQMKIASRSLSFFIDYVQNESPKDHAQGYLLGLKYGITKNLKATYTYREVQADAVLGSLNDSDFIGGGTDGKGHKVQIKWGFTEGAAFALSYFMNVKNIRNKAMETNFNLTQFDFLVRF